MTLFQNTVQLEFTSGKDRGTKSELNMLISYLNDERSALFHNRIFHLIGLLHWVVDMSSKTASWSPTPGMDTHLSTRKGWVVKKISIILLSLEGMLTICSRSQ